MEILHCFEDIEVGSSLPPLVKEPVDHDQLVRYAGASGDFNPLHVDPQAGKAVGLDQIAHGMLIMGFVGQAVTGWVQKKYLKKLKVNFMGMTFLNDVVTMRGTITDKIIENGHHFVIGEVSARNQNQDLLVSGTFTLDLPSKINSDT